ncbi:MAG TPA: phosphatidylglycerophosphatase A [Candidatus Acidoferrales bacterium]
MSAPAGSPLSPASSEPRKKPGLSIFIATAGGLGYLPKAPGTWGALGGTVLTLLPFLLCAWISMAADAGGIVTIYVDNHNINAYLLMQIVLGLIIAAIGVWSAGRAARFWDQEDPQKVVIDEVSGQHLAVVLGCALPISRVVYGSWQTSIWGYLAHDATLNWKYLLLGFILFRVFDIWKPYPARQAESLPGGWGIMADDWMAGIYAAIGLWIARAAGI